MTSEIYLIALTLITLAVMGLVLYLHRSMAAASAAAHAQTIQASERSFQELRASLESQTNQMQDLLVRTTEHLLQTTTQELARAQMAQMTAMDEMTKRSTTGLQSHLGQTTKLLADAIALVGARDPLAYQQLVAAQTPIDYSTPVKPYTAADEFALQAQLEQERQVAEAVNNALGGIGVNGYGVAPTFQPSVEDHVALGFGGAI